ncbi:dTDP-4-dehydrorhamnose 3,5-epimerase [Pedobacter psychrotolerans]|uniref:dTDP-4-dehydrorhamnose 3,5-epimerase n=1 Tax=Pedobacter psychrotolerans TaxID=1843235 RepID=A0A4R2HED1_9SPHI|nr:dTDP-4-dehydrorhamnose 3,5-epimerase family protein [Pedobacter psychrotolerans]TCO26689.1 dTDP-4-dehydrorhamnose 3,5-epimerase [Pedobacter psychrotolerans]GGE55757.1 dTDP-4-dehydrorhamnose 3,5-epimerase [Pedobacter psychrotolerans]
MKIVSTEFENLFIMDYSSYKDNRGEFVKTIHKQTFDEFGLESVFTESFYSVSAKDVIRGMHYQNPPEDHVKLVYVLTGAIIDVVLDIRKESITYGKYFFVELSQNNRNGIYIGKGFAHGFLALEDDTTVEYHTTTSQHKEFEAGIRYDSFGFDWKVSKPIMSDRDLAFQKFTETISLF